VTEIKLLIADDNPDDARLVAHRVKRAGFAVDWLRVEDEDGFAREVSAADLVICDFAMPKFSPTRALEILHERQLDTPLLLISGSVSVESAQRILALGAAGFALKDHLENLGQAVRDALARTPVELP